MSSERLNVIALISGGKDSFFSLLHCIHHGHRVVALANLHPADNDAGEAAAREVQVIEPGSDGERTGGPAPVPAPAPGGAAAAAAAPLQDLNSFMYQTVGHEVVPLYAAATDLPLYRQPIVGEAVRHGRDYDYATNIQSSAASSAPDETESMLSLLQAVKARHPEANAVCAGAILSTYQRTRVESVALRLGLVPLAYLWKYPILPYPTSHGAASPVDDAQLLRDMAAVGLEARIIKVASAGLDEDHLWERVTSDAGAARVKRALSKFGAADGAALGEGGEFETIVLDGPAHLFKRRINVPDEGRTVIREGGGSNWLMIQGAHIEGKATSGDGDVDVVPQTPDLLDPPFASLLDDMREPDEPRKLRTIDRSSLLARAPSLSPTPLDLFSWTVSAEPSEHDGTIEAETLCVVRKIRERLSAASLDASDITTVVIILRDMSAFPKVNGEYGKLFTRPNPPSRVTISCGELLQEGSNIGIYLTAPANPNMSDREGLHVQSRSYWAPANIGPYSQAIDVPVVSRGKSTGLRIVSIAGQIPLIPASMELPTPSDTALQTEVVLSLQHLWRVGAQMGVQCWTSAVAYFARAPSEADMQRSAALASRSWMQIHAAPDEDDGDAEDAVDPWDLKYNPQYASLGSVGQRTASRQIPDWSVFTMAQQNEPDSCIPPFFAVEVESLPRQSAVEWHAHAGLSGVNDSSVEFVSSAELGTAGWRACHMIVRATDSIFVHTTVSYILTVSSVATSWESLTEAMSNVYAQSLQNIKIGESSATLAGAPYLAYVDTVTLPGPWSPSSTPSTDLPFAVIPCRSIWSSEGKKAGCVGVYRTTLTVANST